MFASSGRTYQVRTYGCQMNVHDSERLAGLLEAAGLPARGRRRPTPTSSCSTPARSARTPTTSCTATSATSRRVSRPTPTCRSPSAAAWRRRTATPSCEGAVGRRRVRHPQHRVAAGAARPRPPQSRGAGRDRSRRWRNSRPRCPRARVRVRRLGFDLRRLQQHLHVLHRARAARQGGRPQARRRARRGPSRWSTRASSRSRCWARTSTPTASRSPTPISAIAARSASCCAPAGEHRRPRSGCGSPRRTRRSSPTT